MTPILSILICTVPGREVLLSCLMAEIKTQIENSGVRMGAVETLINWDNFKKTTGQKRNELLMDASGDYVVFVDDDDQILPGYIHEILEAATFGRDAIGMRGYMTTNGESRIPFKISKDCPYALGYEDRGPIYLRFNNHISPLRREIAQRFKFEDVTDAEDFKWAKAIHEAAAIKTEYFIDKEIYHYKFVTGKKKSHAMARAKSGRQNNQ